jgi:hypothetical protein
MQRDESGTPYPSLPFHYATGCYAIPIFWVVAQNGSDWNENGEGTCLIRETAA